MRTLIVLLLILLSFCTTKQESPIHIDFTLARPAMQAIDSIEKLHNGARAYAPYSIGVGKDYFPNVDKYTFGEPIIFIRDTGSLRTAVSYFYSKPDSVVRLIEYAWSFKKSQPEVIRNLYNSNKVTLSKYFNNAGTETEQKEWSQKTTVWQNGSVHVMQFIIPWDEPNRTRVVVRWE